MQTHELMYFVLELNTGKDKQLKQVKWLKPSAGWHKLNTDGSVVNTNGLSGCDGCLEIAPDRNCCCVCLKLNFRIASGKQIFVPML
uniref:Uncharacterized protein n=1 Tax=Quercus lobata TaxID=97700 RepID=A0A7N2LNI1_QUELO